MEKVCQSCRQTKASSEFYKHPRTKDGLLGKCKECQKQSSRAARDADIERYRQYDRERSMQAHRVAARETYQKTSAYRESHAASVERWKEVHALRRAAQVILGNAIRSGKVIPWPICADPDCSSKPEAHHPDYDRPLDVVWLCAKHHRAAHRLAKKVTQQ